MRVAVPEGETSGAKKAAFNGAEPQGESEALRATGALDREAVRASLAKEKPALGRRMLRQIEALLCDAEPVAILYRDPSDRMQDYLPALARAWIKGLEAAENKNGAGPERKAVGAPAIVHAHLDGRKGSAADGLLLAVAEEGAGWVALTESTLSAFGASMEQRKAAEGDPLRGPLLLLAADTGMVSKDFLEEALRLADQSRHGARVALVGSWPAPSAVKEIVERAMPKRAALIERMELARALATQQAETKRGARSGASSQEPEGGRAPRVALRI
jgi:hypothetical protein